MTESTTTSGYELVYRVREAGAEAWREVMREASDADGIGYATNLGEAESGELAAFLLGRTPQPGDLARVTFYGPDGVELGGMALLTPPPGEAPTVAAHQDKRTEPLPGYTVVMYEHRGGRWTEYAQFPANPSSLFLFARGEKHNVPSGLVRPGAVVRAELLAPDGRQVGVFVVPSGFAVGGAPDLVAAAEHMAARIYGPGARTVVYRTRTPREHGGDGEWFETRSHGHRVDALDREALADWQPTGTEARVLLVAVGEHYLADKLIDAVELPYVRKRPFPVDVWDAVDSARRWAEESEHQQGHRSNPWALVLRRLLDDYTAYVAAGLVAECGEREAQRPPVGDYEPNPTTLALVELDHLGRSDDRGKFPPIESRRELRSLGRGVPPAVFVAELHAAVFEVENGWEARSARHMAALRLAAHVQAVVAALNEVRPPTEDDLVDAPRLDDHTSPSVPPYVLYLDRAWGWLVRDAEGYIALTNDAAEAAEEFFEPDPDGPAGHRVGPAEHQLGEYEQLHDQGIEWVDAVGEWGTAVLYVLVTDNLDDVVKQP